MTHLYMQYFVPMVYEFIIAAITSIVIIMIGRKYREKRNNVTKFMFLFSLMLNISVLISAISRVLRVTNAWELNSSGVGTYIELLVFTVSLIAIANIFLLAFTLEVFYGGIEQRKNKIIVFLYSILVVIFIIFTFTTSFIVQGLANVGLNNDVWIFLIIISTIVYVFMIQAAWKVARKAERGLQKRSTQIIALSPLSFLIVFVFFMIDSFVGGHFSIFYYIGWAFAIVSVFTLYIGVVRPGWFINMVKPVGL